MTEPSGAKQGGQVRYYLGIHRDITEMRHLQHQVASQKALIETAIDLTPTAMALFDDHDARVLDTRESKKLASLFAGGEPAHHVLTALLGAEGQGVKLPGDSFSEREFVVEKELGALVLLLGAVVGGTLRIGPPYERGCRFEIVLPGTDREVG